MARFSYTAEKADGEVYTGVAEARDRFELYQVIKREGGKMITFHDESGTSWTSRKYWDEKFSRVTEQHKIVFARNLGAMLSAGLALSRALAVIERQAGAPKLSLIVAQIESEVRRGAALHVALGKFPKVFSTLMIAMVRSGEESGDLPGALKLTSDQMERASALKKKIKSAMVYPIIVLIAICGIGVLMMVFVVPTLSATFASLHAQLPTSTTVIIGISNALTQHTLLAASIFVLVMLLLTVALRSQKGQLGFSWLLLQLPVIGNLVREINAARTARSLASLVSSGVDVLTALDITADIVQNPFFVDVIDKAKTSVAAGEPLSSAFLKYEKLYPPLVGEMMAVGEETGQTGDMLRNLAIFYEEEVDRKTKDLSTIVEPLLMLVIGAAVGFFAISIISPIYSIGQSF